MRAADTDLLGASYAIDLGPRLTLTPSVTVVNAGRHTVFSSATPLSIVPSASRWDAGATLADRAGRWSATLNCDNCTNETVIRTVFAELPYYQDPRIWSLTFRMNF